MISRLSKLPSDDDGPLDEAGETAKRVVAIHQMTAAERAVFVRHLAAATLHWALADLRRDGSDDDSETTTCRGGNREQ